jgi:hypothetical protein
MKLYFGGGEVPSHRKLFAENGVKDCYLSYVGLARRVEFKRKWLINDKFPEDMNVLLESGAFTYNKQEGNQDLDTLAEVAAAYHAFIADNYERVVAFTEFDALALGRDWLAGVRSDFYDDFGDKFMPVWHSEYGTDELERLATRYKRIAILQTELGDNSLVPLLNMLAQRRGTLLHGLAMTKPDIMREVRWDSVGSTSWTSCMAFGDTQVWTGRELKRYPKALKDQARKRHRTLFTNAGFDAKKIDEDDTAEVAKLTFWSWEQLLTDINRRAAFSSVTHRADPPITDEPETGIEPVAHLVEQNRNEQLAEIGTQPATQIPRQREQTAIPGGFIPTDHGVGINSETVRQCDTCFLKDRGCPGYEPGAACAYKLSDITINSKELLDQTENTIIQKQRERIEFMLFAEQVEGGYADANLSTEMDRLMRFIKMKREGTAEKFSINISSSRQPGEASPLDMFGPQVIQANTVKAIEDDIVEADVVSNSPLADEQENTDEPA